MASVFQGSSGITINGGTFNAAGRDIVTNTNNYHPGSTQNNIGNVGNLNTGPNYGTINQNGGWSNEFMPGGYPEYHGYGFPGYGARPSYGSLSPPALPHHPYSAPSDHYSQGFRGQQGGFERETNIQRNVPAQGAQQQNNFSFGGQAQNNFVPGGGQRQNNFASGAQQQNNYGSGGQQQNNYGGGDQRQNNFPREYSESHTQRQQRPRSTKPYQAPEEPFNAPLDSARDHGPYRRSRSAAQSTEDLANSFDAVYLSPREQTPSPPNPPQDRRTRVETIDDVDAPTSFSEPHAKAKKGKMWGLWERRD